MGYAGGGFDFDVDGGVVCAAKAVARAGRGFSVGIVDADFRVGTDCYGWLRWREFKHSKSDCDAIGNDDLDGERKVRNADATGDSADADGAMSEPSRMRTAAVNLTAGVKTP